MMMVVIMLQHHKRPHMYCQCTSTRKANVVGGPDCLCPMMLIWLCVCGCILHMMQVADPRNRPVGRAQQSQLPPPQQPALQLLEAATAAVAEVTAPQAAAAAAATAAGDGAFTAGMVMAANGGAPAMPLAAPGMVPDLSNLAVTQDATTAAAMLPQQQQHMLQQQQHMLQ